MRSQKNHIPILKYKDVQITYGVFTTTTAGCYYKNVDLQETFGISGIIFVQVIYWTSGLVSAQIDSRGVYLNLISHDGAPSATGHCVVRGFYIE